PVPAPTAAPAPAPTAVPVTVPHPAGATASADSEIAAMILPSFMSRLLRKCLNLQKCLILPFLSRGKSRATPPAGVGVEYRCAARPSPGSPRAGGSFYPFLSFLPPPRRA